MEGMRKLLNKLHKNGDGKISSGELKSILSAFGSTPSSDEVGRIISEMDKDGIGYIDLEEFIAFHLTSSDADGSQNGNKELKEAFDIYDLDKNGLISANELHAVLTRLGEKCSLSECQRMISQIDEDGDGNVSFEEFKKVVTNA